MKTVTKATFIVIMTTVVQCAFAQGPLTEAFTSNYTEMKENLILSAAAVPQEKYAYKLTPPQLSFSGWLTHSVGALYFFCYRFGGVPAPPRETLRNMSALTT